ncbi:hypothetical protein [Amycolatopsis sp. NPDC059021]|uniref:hypothetical protein n=1 Tax=Amycolatopsis sp. NPDC059021 TaxID=3346704 RepID=UPI00366F78FF
MNEYGSRLHITGTSDGRVEGTFTTALGDSSFAGATVPIASFTGLLREDTLHMAWHVVSDRAVKRPRPDAEPAEIELPWAHAVLSNTDTFHRHA